MNTNDSADQPEQLVPFGSSDAARKGGEARAKRLSPEERSAIAAKGGNARALKGKPALPKATHEGVLLIGDIEIPCAVLETGQRVITQSGVMKALGRARQAKGRQHYNADVNMPAFLTAANLKPFTGNDLLVTSTQLDFETMHGIRAFGYPAELLPRFCWVYIDAKNAGKLVKAQEQIAEHALTLVRAFGEIGLVSLIDEATGYQLDRPRRELEKLLSKYLSESLRRWVRTFPADYFKHLCRLRGVEFRSDMRLPPYFGTLTNNLIYRRLAPGILKMLKRRKAERGNESDHLHSWLSEDTGIKEVLLHLGVVVGLMKVNTDYDTFERLLDRVAPIYPDSPGLFDNPADWNERG